MEVEECMNGCNRWARNFTTMQRRSWVTTFCRLSSQTPALPRLNYAAIAPRFCYEAPRRHLASAAGAPKLRFGQPMFETHPHLLKSGEGFPHKLLIFTITLLTHAQ